MSDFLDRLMRIPWESMRTAHGFAAHVPLAIVRLTSPDPQSRNWAYWKLDNHVVLQSDLYEAAADVVPFLVEMLEGRPPFGRREIYDLLFELVNGYAVPYLASDEVGNDGTPANAGDTKAMAANAVSLRRRCRAAGRQGIAIYRRDADDPDPAIRSTIMDILESLDEDDGDDEGSPAPASVPR